MHWGPRFGMERCGKINSWNSASESCTGIGVVAGFWAGMGMMYWPYLKISVAGSRNSIFKFYNLLAQFEKLATT